MNAGAFVDARDIGTERASANPDRLTPPGPLAAAVGLDPDASVRENECHSAVGSGVEGSDGRRDLADRGAVLPLVIIISEDTKVGKPKAEQGSASPAHLFPIDDRDLARRRGRLERRDGAVETGQPLRRFRDRAAGRDALDHLRSLGRDVLNVLGKGWRGGGGRQSGDGKSRSHATFSPTARGLSSPRLIHRPTAANCDIGATDAGIVTGL